MQKLATLGMISFGLLTGIYLSISLQSPAIAQMGPSTQNGGDALWHLPKFGEQGWFIHANNGKVRVCNMDKTSVIGAKAGPRCSNWE